MQKVRPVCWLSPWVTFVLVLVLLRLIPEINCRARYLLILQYLAVCSFYGTHSPYPSVPKRLPLFCSKEKRRHFLGVVKLWEENRGSLRSRLLHLALHRKAQSGMIFKCTGRWKCLGKQRNFRNQIHIYSVHRWSCRLEIERLPASRRVNFGTYLWNEASMNREPKLYQDWACKIKGKGSIILSWARRKLIRIRSLWIA